MKSFKKWFKLRLKFVQNLTSLFLLMSLYSMTTIIGKYMVYCRNKVFFNRFQCAQTKKMKMKLFKVVIFEKNKKKSIL